MSTTGPIEPYGSARDLPSVQEIERQIAAFRLFRLLLPKAQRRQLPELEREQRRITSLVDSFYDILGRRNWVFTSDLDLSAIEQVIATNEPETAETLLIDYYNEDERIAFPLERLYRFEAMRPRMNLLKKALADYQSGRYYSAVLVLLTVMDGFVNDLDKSARQGLHARSPQDMVAWDSVAGHHLGLSHAQESFLRGFRKTDEAKVTELYRNGIMHGTLINFDNEIVATKAWNRLFAVADWADSVERRAKPAEPVRSLRESVTRWKEIQEQKELIERWKPHEYKPDLPSDSPPDLLQTCVNFFNEWQSRQWGPVGAHFMEFGTSRSSVGKVAVLAKDLYGSVALTSWTIHLVRHVAAAVAHVDVDLLVNGRAYRTDLRWVRVDDSGITATEWEPGHWVLAPYGPSHFLTPEAIVEGLEREPV